MSKLFMLALVAFVSAADTSDLLALSTIPTPGTPADSILLKEPHVVVMTQITPERAPKQPQDVLRECTNNDLCNSVLDEIGDYYGVPKGTAKLIVKFVPGNGTGETTFYNVNVPEGYRYCSYTIKTISINPPTGDRASFIEVSSTDAGVEITTWTPKQQYGGGRSWVDALVTVRGVRQDLASNARNGGGCQSPNATKFACRGDFNKSQINHGQPGCGLITTDLGVARRLSN